MIGLTGSMFTLTLTSRYSAPRDSACSFTAGRTSNNRTIEPMFLAVPAAARPATPPPMMKTFAGGTLPAAVICPENITLQCTLLVQINKIFQRENCKYFLIETILLSTHNICFG